MIVRRFIDTNVVVYAYDSSAGTKQATAQQVLREAALPPNEAKLGVNSQRSTPALLSRPE